MILGAHAARDRALGIDPGVTGAVALIERGPGRETVQVWDMPVLTIRSGRSTKTKVDAHGLVRVLSQAGDVLFGSVPVHAFIENVHAMPGQGVTSMFSFGTSLGVILGIIAAQDVPYTMVEPNVWTRAMMVKRVDDASRVRALQLFPQASHLLTRKSDHGRADAILLAAYGLNFL